MHAQGQRAEQLLKKETIVTGVVAFLRRVGCCRYPSLSLWMDLSADHIPEGGCELGIMHQAHPSLSPKESGSRHDVVSQPLAH